LEVKNVTRLFGDVRALSSVSFTAGAGDVVAVMGPNGAGKSTLLSILSLTMRPSRGTLLFDDKIITGTPCSVRAKVGYLSHLPLVYPHMTPAENLLFFAQLYGLNDKSVIEKLIARLGISAYAFTKRCSVLSRGQLQKVSLARALIGNPWLLLLDEPASGLDRQAVMRIEDVVYEHRERGGVVIAVTHEPELVYKIATRVLMLKNGRKVVDMSVDKESLDLQTIYHDAIEERALF
jgi:heme exporter protein A